VKSLRMLLLFALLILALGANPGVVQAFAFSYTAGFQVQNLSGASANITITYFNQDGTVATSASDSIPGNGSKTYFPILPASGFNGSVVISADQQVAAVTNILGNSGVAAASYVGSVAGSTSVSLPLLMKGNSGYNTWFNIQNTGGSDASVTVNYSDGTNNSATIKPSAAATFDQSAETHNTTVFSATVTGNQPLVATVMEENTAIMFAYSGFGAGSTDPVLPLINANNVGYVTGTQIQNSGGSSTDVTLSYTPSAAGTACTETQTIPAGESKTFTLGAFAGSPPAGTTTDCIGGQKFIGSAQVTGNTASQDLVAIVNQLLPGVNGEAYGGFDPSAATQTVVLPLIMDRNAGYFTGFNVMNVGSSSTTVNCTFTGTSYTASGTLAAGEALTDLQNGKISSGYVGSATCTASNPGDRIVAVVNQLGPSSTADQLLVYEGIPGP